MIGRYGPHLMIVIIFVTQNNFLNGPGISDCVLGFYLFIVLMYSQLSRIYFFLKRFVAIFSQPCAEFPELTTYIY